MVKALLQSRQIDLAQRRVLACPSKGHDAAVIGRDRCLIEADVAKVAAQFGVAVDRFVLLQETDAVLRDENTALIQQRAQPS